MFFSATIGLFCRKGFTRKYLSRMCRSWMCFLFSGLISNFNKNTIITNSITYPPHKFSHTWRGVDVHSVFIGCKGYYLPGELSYHRLNRLRLCVILKDLTGVTYKSFALFIFPELIKKY